MTRIKKIVLSIALISSVLLGYSQQDPMFTHYAFNTLSVNPGYAGSRDALSLLGLYRTQWVGLEGAPKTQTFTIHSPVYGKNMGLGLTVLNDVVGPVHQTQFYLDYSYALKLTELTDLRLGIKAGFGIYEGNLEDLNREDPNDAYIFNFKGAFMPNVGVGALLIGPRGYLGLSVPKIIKGKIKDNSGIEIGDLRTHYFLIGGYLFDLTEDFVFKPTFLFKAVSGAPMELDLSGMLYFKERFGLGLSYRTRDSFSALVHIFLTPKLYLGYSHDFTMTPLRNYHKGTHEFILGYDFIYSNRNRIYSPRFF